MLQDINLTIGKGEVVVVIGPSGSGKSTLCRTINRLETLRVRHHRDRRPAPARGGQGAGRNRADVGMVFQSFNLFAHKTILQNVTLGPMKARKVGKADAEKRGMERSSGWASPSRRRSTLPGSPAASSSASPSHGSRRWTPR